MHLGVPVHAVAWSERGVRVAVEGAELEAEACLLAVPASVTGRIRFDPPLPAWKSDALERVVYGHAAKLFVPLRRVPPPKRRAIQRALSRAYRVRTAEWDIIT